MEDNIFGKLNIKSNKSSTPTAEKTTEQLLQTQYDNLGARLGAVGAEVDDRNVIGRFLNLEQDQGLFMDIGEVLDRTGQGTKQAILAQSKGGNVLTGFWKGLSGQEELTGLEFQEAMGWKTAEEIAAMTGAEQFVNNVATDMIFDPLTYLPAGFMLKGLKKLNRFGQDEVVKQLVANVDEIKRLKVAEVDTLTTQFMGEGLTRNKAVAKAKKQAGYITSQKLTETITKNVDDLKILNKKIEGLKKSGIKEIDISKNLSASELELYGLEKTFKNFEAAASEMKVLGNDYKIARFGGSAPGTVDLGIFADVSGNGDFYRVSSIEVKKAIGKTGAYGPTAVLQKSKNGVIQFGGRTRLTKVQQEVIQTKYSKIVLSDGSTVANRIDDLMTGSQKAGFGVDGLTAADQAKIGDAAKEIWREAGYDYMYVVASDGTEGLYRFNDIVDDMVPQVKVRRGTGGKGGLLDQTRLNVNFELPSVAKKSEAWEALMSESFGAKVQDITIKKQVGLLSFLAERDEFYSPTVQRIIDMKNGFANLFDPFRGYSKETRAAIRGLDGQARQTLFVEGRRIAALSEEALRANKNGTTIIKELLESGARIVNGQVQLNSTSYNLGHLLTSYADEFLKYGDDMSVPIYGGKVKAQNVLTNLNDAYRKVTGITDDAFKWVQKGDQYFLSLDAVDPDTFRRILKNQDAMALFGSTSLDIGKKTLSTEYIDFFLANEELVSQFARTQDDIIDLFRTHLGPENLPDFMKTTNGYARHVLSNEGSQILKELQPLAKNKNLKAGVDTLAQRKYLGTSEDINKAMKAYYSTDIDFFDPTITSALGDLLQVGIRKNQSHELLQLLLREADTAGRNFFEVIDNKIGATLGPDYRYMDNFKAEFNSLYKGLSPQAQQVLDANFIKNGFGEGKAIAIHKRAYDTLKQFENAYRELPEFIKAFDAVQNQWKSLNLITPTFHINNFFGNMTNSYLQGMDLFNQQKYLGRSMTSLQSMDSILTKVDDLIRTGLKRDDAIKQLSKADRSTYDMLFFYFNDGVSMKMAGVRDLEGFTNVLTEGGQKNLYQKLAQANFDLAENADELQRFALYNWAYDKQFAKLSKAGGLSEEAIKLKARAAASETVFESLFDYSNYTMFEKDVMKRVIPFYTFMKNNFAFQAQNILKNPAPYAKLTRGYNYYVDDIAGIDQSQMPEYARDNLWLPIPITVGSGDKETITFLKANLPPAEFAELIESRFARGVSSLSIPLKLPIELALNRDLFTGAEIKEFPGQKDQMEAGTGFLSQFRDSQGAAALTADPTIQKLGNDLGLRVPLRFLTTALDIVDGQMGYKEPVDSLYDALDSLGVLATKNKEDINVTNLYQALEKYRNAEKRWEQEEGIDLPTKAELNLP